MDYSNFAGQQSQPYSLYGLPTPDHQPQSHNDDALRDPFSLVWLTSPSTPYNGLLFK